MKSLVSLVMFALFAVLLLPGAKMPDEGMWLPGSAGDFPASQMQKRGLRLRMEELFSESHPSIKDAIALLGGGTASFVSPAGLMLTNHHVAFSAIQSLSTIQQDYLKDGYWARSRADELPTSYTAQIVRSMKEVTTEALSGVHASMTPEERARTIQTNSAAIEAKAREATGNVCRVSSMYCGNKYYLTTYLLLSDIRLVYAPPGSIGNFGGEVDNWMWPRHTGDFSFLRAYIGRDGKPARYAPDNIPYTPKKFLPISIRGYAPGSFAMVLGFPGRTFRYREAAGIQIARDVVIPTTIALYKTRIEVIDKAGKRDRAVQIKYASRMRSLANTYKNYLGTLEGIRRSDLLERKREEEQQFDRYLHAVPDPSQSTGTLLAELGRADSSAGRFEQQRLLIRNLSLGVSLLGTANRISSFLASEPKDSLGNPLPPSDDRNSELNEFLTKTFREYDENLDRELLVSLILKSAELPADQRLQVFAGVLGEESEEDRAREVRRYVDDVYNASLISSQQGCQDLLKRDPESIADDQGMKLAAAIRAEAAVLHTDSLRNGARLELLRGEYIKAWLAWKKLPFSYPDANRTLRFSFGIVEGYSPRDAVTYGYRTTLSGVMEKERTEEPFEIPPKLRALWETKDFGPYADPKLGDVPVAFISDLDITGGNSGSPVINGRGELIGCAFDGNWESVVSDYRYEERFDRTISVDARYILFVLDKFSGAQNIVKELVIR